MIEELAREAHVGLNYLDIALNQAGILKIVVKLYRAGVSVYPDKCYFP